jgi:hypothetical protein
MPARFYPRPVVLLLSLCLAATMACKKGAPSADGSGNQTPAVTGIGIPVGDPVSQDMDASGGSLTSPDGKLTVVIPAGALSATTTISIQPVTNTTPGGIGTSYQLMPEGTTFSQPVTITFHYSDDDVNGSLPYFLYIAFQDSAGYWDANLKERNLDTVAKTVSVASTHFSIWSAFENIKMIAGQDDYNQGETSYFEIIEVLKPSTKAAGASADDELAYSLPITSTLPDNIVNNWSLNGEGTHTLVHGNITGSGAHVTYTAPVVIQEEATVQVSAEVKFTDIIISYSSGKQIATFNKLVLFHSIKLLPELDFTLTIERGDSQPASTAFDYGYTYIQQCTMDLQIIGSEVNVSNISNNPPQYTTQPSTVGEQCHIVEITPDDIGELHVTATKGVADQSRGIFNLSLTTAPHNSIQYTYQCNCPNCPIGTHNGTAFGEQKLDTPDFKLTDDPQPPIIDGNATQYYKFTLTPK